MNKPIQPTTKTYWQKCRKAVYFSIVVYLMTYISLGILIAGLTIPGNDSCDPNNPICKDDPLKFGLTIAGGVLLGIVIILDMIGLIWLGANRCWGFMALFFFL